MLLNEAADLIFIRRAGVRERIASMRGYERDARQFASYIHNCPVGNVLMDDIERWVVDLRAAGYSQNAISFKCSALRKLFTALRRRGQLVLDPADIPLPRKEIKEPHVATDEQISKLLAVIPEHTTDRRLIRNRAIILLLRDTGMRVGELTSLDIDDVELNERRAKVHTEKSRWVKPFRRAFWFAECDAALREWLRTREELLQHPKVINKNALFIGTKGGNMGHRMGNAAVEIAIRSLCREARIPTLNPHSFRHRKGHLLAKQGASNSIISGVLGHSDLSSSFVYTMLNDTELEEVARRYEE